LTAIASSCSPADPSSRWLDGITMVNPLACSVTVEGRMTCQNAAPSPGRTKTTSTGT
jgi:hypothetical protein